MAANGSGISEALVNGPVSKQAPFYYRSFMGMVPSAEHQVFFDDFEKLVTTNVPNGWAAAVIDTGATVVQATSATTHPGTGTISFVSSTASEGAAIYMPKSVKLRTGKKALVECRMYVDDVTDHAFQMGLTDLTATSNPEDLWTTTAANVAAFGILDGQATTQFLVDENNGGTSVIAGTRSITASQWTILAVFFDGVNISAFVDGKLSATVTTAADIPTGVMLAPFLGSLNGNGAGGALALVDWFRVVQER